MFYSHSILKPTAPTPSTFASLKLQNFTTPNGSLLSVCYVCMQIWHIFHIRDRRYRIEINLCASISLECAKVKLSIINNFGLYKPILMKLCGLSSQISDACKIEKVVGAHHPSIYTPLLLCSVLQQCTKFCRQQNFDLDKRDSTLEEHQRV